MPIKPKAKKKDNKKSAYPKSETTTTAMADQALTLDMLIAELGKNRSDITKELTNMIQNSLSPIQTTLEVVQHKVEFYGSRLTDMETALSDHSDRIVSLEDSVSTLTASMTGLKSENDGLKDKLDDYENRARRCNLRVIGVPENCEGQSPLTFMSEFLVKILNDDSFTKPPELDRAHRALMPKPASGERPRPFILCFHRYQEKNRVLQLAIQKRQLMYDGKKIFIFQDLSPRLASKRNAFKKVKSLFYEKGIKFSMRYPATLLVNFEGSRFSFDSAESAEAFYDQRIRK